MSDMTQHLREQLRSLHREIDLLAGGVAGQHTLQCRRGCASCCVDELTVFEVEADRIRESFAKLLETGEPGPVGGCAFLDGEGACRIYEARPYVCRTQGLPLRWLEEDEEEEVVELRDICPLNAETTPPETLDEEACWTIGPFEERLAELQAAADGGAMRRLPLRDLFRPTLPA